MVYPITGEWTLAPGTEPVLGNDFFEKKLDHYRKCKAVARAYIPDGHHISDEVTESALMECFYRRVFAAMGERLTDEQFAFLTSKQLAAERYGYFPDVLPHLRRWQDACKLAIVSDAPPSTRRILQEKRLLEPIRHATFSFELGTLKPDPRMYETALNALGVRPEEAVFVDDGIGNLRGAQALGIRAIQMRREMPARYPMDDPWEGEIARDFAELGRMLDLPSLSF